MNNNIACKECPHRGAGCGIGYTQFPSSEGGLLHAAANNAEVCQRVIDKYDKETRFWVIRQGGGHTSRSLA